MARLRVKHFVLTNTVRQDQGQRYTDALGVSYFYRVPADTEFPYRVGKLELFVRFMTRDLRPTRLRVVMVALDSRVPERVYDADKVLTPAPLDGWMVFDRGIKLVDFLLPAEGRYRVRIYCRVRHRLYGRQWRRLASESFWVERVT